MQFNLQDLKELLLCIKTNELQSITIKKDKFELVINRKLLIANSNYNYITNLNYIPSTISKPSLKVNPITDNKENIVKGLNIETPNQETEIYFTIVSPMVGTFYRSPSPSEPYFVEVDDYVKNTQTVCIVEAMKLMNEIEAEVSGQIIEILVKDGDIVDCGQPLMKIKQK
uniref:Biotin carboxyl carrier protein of acetyl-CoA carboxylase n=1 Tax=Dichotomaria marginata TaxID=268567 RepID=A0A1G4NSI5_9FLOR|nr:Acetyl-CoA carboxylase, biotin carboxyl carrier protein [Dichotomaria marginata]SCW21584.1 Acetyl-CoA carboxylase, biotin carboxyl carrier protein [Dichotomaria marginata]